MIAASVMKELNTTNSFIGETFTNSLIFGFFVRLYLSIFDSFFAKVYVCNFDIV